MLGSNNSRSPRIMMYSQDGFGLGHMRRTTSIARQILSTRPDACVLTVADSRLGQFFETVPHQDYIKLPSVVKVGPGTWRAVDMPLPFEEVHAMRQDLIRSAVLTFRPHVFLVDHMPHGAMGELLPALAALKGSGADTQVVLGLRDILDAPEVVQRRWQIEGAYDAIERYYDKVLVYGERQIYDMAAHYNLSPTIVDRMRYTGYICTPDQARYPARARAKYLANAAPDTKLIVVMAGGGADAYPMMRACLDALPTIRAQQPVTMMLNTGPFMPTELRRDLQTRARGIPGAQVAISVNDTLSYLEAADLVVAMCGYNTTMELLRSRRPAILIPRAGPSAEQRTRARLFAEQGWVKMLDPDDPGADLLAEMALASLRGDHPSPIGARPNLEGLTTATNELLDFLPRAQDAEQQVLPITIGALREPVAVA
jgi:predicted glycosyltransferase